MPTIGSLCAGIAGLDLAVEHHFDADLIWYSDNDPHANEVMAVRRPDAMALGDLTAVDPSTVKAPDIVTCGWPCTPVSIAGSHRGISDDRWIFHEVMDFISGLPERPTWIVLENVRNLISHDQGRTALEVVRTVAALGLDLRWGLVRASDAGLPHQRARWFALASDPDQPRPQGPQPARRRLVSAGSAPAAHDVDWGHYADAIARWEMISGRPAPLPTDERRRLNPAFTEWAMGFEPGWVTDIITTRTHNLRLLGNAVCPPQAALALDLLK